MRGAAMNKRNNGRRIFWGRMEPPKMCGGALGRENIVQTILPPDNTVADVLSIEQCCRSMIFRFFGGFHWLREPICLGSSRIMYPVKAETMEPAIVISRVPA